MNGWFSLSIVGSLIQLSRVFSGSKQAHYSTAMSQFTKLIQIVTAAIQKWVSSTSSLGSHSYKITLSYWCGIVTLVINSIILFIDHVILILYHTYILVFCTLKVSLYEWS